MRRRVDLGDVVGHVYCQLEGELSSIRLRLDRFRRRLSHVINVLAIKCRYCNDILSKKRGRNYLLCCDEGRVKQIASPSTSSSVT